MKKILMAAILVMMAVIFACAAANAETTKDITKKCKFKSSGKNISRLYDDKIKTRWSYNGDSAYVGIQLPEGGANYMRINWAFEPEGVTVTLYDADLNPMDVEAERLSCACIEEYYKIDPSAAYIKIDIAAKEKDISEIRIFRGDELPEDAHVWLAPYEKCDLMVVSTHQDDELIFFGGIIPYYEHVMHKKVQVVYMANCSHFRRMEALNGLWAMGIRHYPLFNYLADKRTKTYDAAIELWDGEKNIISVMVGNITRFKPEVILTHDYNGEYGHNQHKVTSRLFEKAIEEAKDTWQVKKFYRHLWNENGEILFDWNKAYDELNGKTPLEVARIGYAKHASQQKYYQVENHGKHDNAKFGLVMSTVGYDTELNDLFENIPETDDDE